MNIQKTVIAISLSLACYCSNAQTPFVFLVKGTRLVAVQNKIKNGDETANKWLKTIIRTADKALEVSPGSVMMKIQTPPSGSKHDYMSLAPYYWPDSTKPNNIPYMRKDGQRNPEIYLYTDHKYMDEMERSIRDLSLAFYFTKEEKYAAKATEFLRTWFIDTATKMNPNLQFAQAVKGVNEGRGTGLIETNGLPTVENAIGLLAGSKSWTKTNNDQLQAWFDSFYHWMLESKNGQSEHKAKNNHGIWYDFQIVSHALFLNKKEEAKAYLKTSLTRIPVQIELDGRQPMELERTAALSYSTFSLEAWFKTCVLADNVGLDLWNYSTEDGRSIKKAFDWLLPYAMGNKKWEYKQIHPYKKSQLYGMLLMAADHYNDKKYYEAAQKIKEEAGNTVVDVFYDK